MIKTLRDMKLQSNLIDRHRYFEAENKYLKMSFEIIDSTEFSDSTSKFRSVMLRMAARGQLGPFINTVDITDTIKM